MSEAPAEYSASATMTAGGADEAIATAQPSLPGLDAPGVAVHPVVQAVVQGVQATTEPENWAVVAAHVLQALQPQIQLAETVSRSSAKTQMTIGLVEATIPLLAGMLQLFFPHPKA